jgi:large subunit ribosomal protein L25
MQKYTLKAQDRELTKKKVSQLRKEGLVPAAIFGFKGNFNIQVPAKEFEKTLNDAGTTALVELEMDGKKHNVYVDEVQMNPATRQFLHVSFREVRMDEEITSTVPFVLVGADESPAVKDEQQLVILSRNEVELRGLPGNLPAELTIDVSGFKTGDTIVLKDIKLPEGVVVFHEEELEDVIVTTTSAVQEEIVEDVQAAIEADAAAKNAEGEEGAATTEGGEAAATPAPAAEEKKE